MSDYLTYKVDALKDSMKLMDVLKNEMHLSTRWIRKLKQEKGVLVNSYNISMNAKLRVGDEIEVKLPMELNIFEPEAMILEILYEDAHFIVVNKPPNMVVHPTKGHPYGTLANGLAHYMVSRNENYKIRFAHRLDRDTSGAIIICKNAHSQKWISDQMIENSMLKGYVALVHGCPGNKPTKIDLPIAEPLEGEMKRRIDESGAKSVTHFEVLEVFEDYSLLKIKLETGRTHQIRVHLSHIGHSILGDPLYGEVDENLNRQALHAKWLTFKNLNGDTVEIVAPMYEDMTKRIEELR